ncbi:hypothetical protein PM082_011501 [Marasmius tenuissimus]|nr:hypothetical protein PM082_011501 [Marasmius tenuissimus]
MNTKLQEIHAPPNKDPIPIRGNDSYGIIEHAILHPVIDTALYGLSHRPPLARHDKH